MREKRKYKSIKFEDRKEIQKKIEAGETPKAIAADVGVHVATIYRELKNGQTEGGYDALTAQCKIAR